MSMRSLHQRLHDMGLKRRNIPYNIQEIRQEIVKNLNGPGCSGAGDIVRIGMPSG